MVCIWNINSDGIFRKGYSDKKETVVKTEPQQPNNAVSTGSSHPVDDKSGISSTEPNGEPTISAGKGTASSASAQETGGENSQEGENVGAEPTEGQKKTGSQARRLSGSNSSKR